MRAIQSFKHQGVRGFKFGYHPFAKPSLFTHVYFIDGLLIDTGQSRMSDAVFNSVKNLPVKQILLTHHHEDHSGNLRRLKDHFGCPVYGSPDCCKMMKDPPAISFAQWSIWGSRPAFYEIIPVAGEIKSNQYSFRVIPVPGHAEDMIALFAPDQGWLFSADLYIHCYIGYFMKTESMATQIQSIRKILSLDFDVLFCSHSPQLTDGKEKLKKKLDFLEHFYSEVAELHRRGFNAKQIFKQLKLKENQAIRILSHGNLTKLNMVHSVIRDETNKGRL